MSHIFQILLPLIGPIIVLAVIAFSIISDWEKQNWRKRFRVQLRAAIAKRTLTYSDLQHIAESWHQDRQKVLLALRILLSESLAEENSALTGSTELIRQLLIEHQSREPYAELPENISLQLAALNPFLPSRSNAVPQLASSLSELYSKNQFELARQKKLAVWGFVVGLLGLLASLPGVFAFFKT